MALRVHPTERLGDKMDFDLTETQQLFKRSARELFTQELPPAVVREMIEKGEPYSEQLWKKLVEQGWTGLIFSEEDGGMGLGVVDLAVACEEMGRALIPGPFISTVPLAGSLFAAGTAEQKAKWLQSICDGKSKATVALLEEGTRWDADGVGMKASDAEGTLTLTGRKLFVSDASVSDLILTPARAGSDLVIAVVPRSAKGLSIKPLPSMDASRNLYEVVYEGVKVESGDVLLRGAPAVRALEHALDVATVALSAEMVGGMQWLLDATVEYAKTRKQFGQPIGKFQAIQHHCANMLLLTESGRSAAYYAAWCLDSMPEAAPTAVSVAKTYISDGYREVSNLGVQVHGGVGFTWDEPVHFYYKRSKASEILFGDANYHRERIAKLVMDEASKPTAA